MVNKYFSVGKNVVEGVKKVFGKGSNKNLTPELEALKGFNKLPEAVQEKINPKLAQEFNMGGMVDKRSPFMGGGIAYAGGGKAMKRTMLKKGGKV